MSPRDAVKATTVVAVDPDVAFEVFTQEIDQWWKRGPRFRWYPERSGTLRFEGTGDGRLVEVYDDASGEGFEVGRVLEWSDPARLAFGLRGRNGEETRVDVSFERVDAGTRVTVVHSGWSQVPPDHPARHGMDETSFGDMMGVWWADLLVSLRRHAVGPDTRGAGSTRQPQ